MFLPATDSSAIDSVIVLPRLLLVTTTVASGRWSNTCVLLLLLLLLYSFRYYYHYCIAVDAASNRFVWFSSSASTRTLFSSLTSKSAKNLFLLEFEIEN